MTASIPKGTAVIIITDCCHSGTIADLERLEWEGYNAIAVSGCTDSQTSGDTGHGGILTHSMLMAIQKLNQGHDRAIQSQGYSLGSLMRAIIEKDNETFHSKQTINI